MAYLAYFVPTLIVVFSTAFMVNTTLEHAEKMEKFQELAKQKKGKAAKELKEASSQINPFGMLSVWAIGLIASTFFYAEFRFQELTLVSGIVIPAVYVAGTAFFLNFHNIKEQGRWATLQFTLVIEMVVLLLLLVATLFSPVVVYAHSPVFLDREFVQQDNGFEEDLNMYLSFLFRDENDFISSWETLPIQERQRFVEHRQQRMDTLLAIYTNPLSTRADFNEWFLEVHSWMSSFQRQAWVPGMVQQFTLPPLGRQFFTYMPVRLLTHPQSNQVRFLPHLTTNQETGFMMYGDAYVIALGTYYSTQIGSIFRLTFENGEQVYAALGDVKSDMHTDPTNRFENNGDFSGVQGNVVEFIMEDRLPQFNNSDRVRLLNNQVQERFPTPVIRIERVGMSYAMSQM